MSEFRLTGGCQCGAVRYALHEEPTSPHICHCRMCQKAFGSFFAPLDRRAARQIRAHARRARDLQELRSDRARLLQELRHAAHIPRRRFAAHRSLASARSTSRKRSSRRCSTASRRGCPGSGSCRRLPGDKTTEEDNPELVAKIAASNHQHPDHDTDWPHVAAEGGTVDAMSAAVSDGIVPAAASAARCAMRCSKSRRRRTSAIAACARRRSARSSRR